jgi:hypothetical protein
MTVLALSAVALVVLAFAWNGWAGEFLFLVALVLFVVLVVIALYGRIRSPSSEDSQGD